MYCRFKTVIRDSETGEIVAGTICHMKNSSPYFGDPCYGCRNNSRKIEYNNQDWRI